MNENNNNRERKTIDDTSEKNDFTISDLNPLENPDKEKNEELGLFSSRQLKLIEKIIYPFFSFSF